MQPFRLLWFGVATLAILAQLATVSHAQARDPLYVVNLPLGLTPASADLVRRALREAEAAEASALIVQLSGSGAVLKASWAVARELAVAKVPIVVWVGPGPVSSGPAGALLLAASDIAAMAPGAQAGFVQPLAVVPAGFSSATRELVLDDVAQELRLWQEQHSRNADWMERAVRHGAMIDAGRAMASDPPVVDLVAATMDELQTSLEGRRVAADGSAGQTITTIGQDPIVVRASGLELLGQVLAVPTVAFVLFVLGAIAIFLEVVGPGVGVPGVSGTVLVLLALYGFWQASVRPLAVLLLVAALVLIGLEHVIMSHGGLTAGGIVLLVAGALWLVDPLRSPGLGVGWLAIVGTSAGLALAMAGLVAVAVRVRHRRPVTGKEGLLGQIAEVRQRLDPEGMVYVAGALWSAWTDQGALERGDLVEVVEVENLRLLVRRVPADLPLEAKV